MRNSRLAVILLIALLTGSLAFAREAKSLFGNSKRQEVNKAQSIGNQRKARGGSRTPAQVKAEARKDTARYLNVVSRYGWYYGIGPQLTPELAAIHTHYRLIRDDSASRYNRIELIDRYGNLTSGQHIPSLLVPQVFSDFLITETGHNADLKAASQWVFYPGKSKVPAMVKAYSTGGDLLYTYHPVMLNDSTVIGHYTDSFGEPIAFCNPDGNGWVAQVTMDSVGHDRTIYYLDREGYPRKNEDGVFGIQRTYENDLLISQTGLLPNGRPMTGYDHIVEWKLNYNEYGHPINIKIMFGECEGYLTLDYNQQLLLTQISGNAKTDSEHLDIYYWSSVYDAFNRPIEITKCFNSDTQYYKVERTVYSDRTPSATTTKTWTDALGNFTYNDDSLACEVKGPGYLAQYRLNEEGRDTVPYLKRWNTAGFDKEIYYGRDSVHYEKRDRQGRVITELTTRLNGTPINESIPFRVATVYGKMGQNDMVCDTIYSLRDTVVEITQTHPARDYRTIESFTKGGQLISRFAQTLDPETGEPNGQYSIDRFGNNARNSSEEQYYYRIISGKTFRGETAYISGLNEYGEPSYVMRTEILSPYVTRINGDARHEDHFLDENLKPVVIDSIERVYCVELKRPEARKTGLMNGDIIMQYGDWSYPEADIDRWNPRAALHMESYLKRDTVKTVAVQRYDSRQKRHVVKTVTLPKGTLDELGIMIHPLCQTKKEATRYDGLASSYFGTEPPAGESMDGGWVFLFWPNTIGEQSRRNHQIDKDVLILGARLENTSGEMVYLPLSSPEFGEQLLQSDNIESLICTENGIDVIVIEESLICTENGIDVIVIEDNARALAFSRIPLEEFSNLTVLEEANRHLITKSE